ncbi:MAG: hypothetical protein ACKKL5_01875 [Candidatus Komeilibacteria bacterium]
MAKKIWITLVFLKMEKILQNTTPEKLTFIKDLADIIHLAQLDKADKPTVIDCLRDLAQKLMPVGSEYEVAQYLENIANSLATE